MTTNNPGGERSHEDVKLAEESIFESPAFAQFEAYIEASLAQLSARWYSWGTPRALRQGTDRASWKSPAKPEASS
ncbi:MAG: hypothetical protein K8T25_11925 [Planctomycetia bacterium]|nr:hypothetical protein [Planctomycetia bacterium]